MVQIGFDVGGTNIAAGVVNSEKRIIQRSSIPFPAGEKYDEVAA
jgi:predicted NBD/HSP70 family sugar kinase